MWDHIHQSQSGVPCSLWVQLAGRVGKHSIHQTVFAVHTYIYPFVQNYPALNQLVLISVPPSAWSTLLSRLVNDTHSSSEVSHLDPVHSFELGLSHFFISQFILSLTKIICVLWQVHIASFITLIVFTSKMLIWFISSHVSDMLIRALFWPRKTYKHILGDRLHNTQCISDCFKSFLRGSLQWNDIIIKT